MGFVKTVFGAVRLGYLIRAYLISAVLLAYSIWHFLNQSGLEGGQRTVMVGYALLSAILFPFAKLVWDEIKGLLSNGSTGTVVLLNEVGIFLTVVRFAGKVIVNIFLWFFAIAIAPLGILYLWLRRRKDQPTS